MILIDLHDGPPTCAGNEEMRELRYMNAHYLAAYEGDDLVGHICHRHDAPMWWVDQLYVVPHWRGRGLGNVLIEANYHYALDRTLELWSRVKMNGEVSPETFYRNSKRMDLGIEVRLHSTSKRFYYVHRNLKPLAEAIATGSKQKITFPYRKDLK